MNRVAVVVVLLVSVGCGPSVATPSPASTPETLPSVAPMSPPDSPGPTPAATETPAPEATLTPPNPPAAFAAWTRADMPDPAPGVFGGGTPRDVIWFSDRYVAVGTIATECCADSDPSTFVGVVWTSRDGHTWRLRDLGSTFAHASLSNLIVIGGKLYAFGSYAEPTPGAIAESRPAAWASQDGVTWRRVGEPVGPRPFPFGAGFVGVEVTGYPDAPVSRFTYSTDGLTWTIVSDPFEIEIRELVVSPGAGALAIGWGLGRPDSDGTWREDLVVFTSLDGVHWTGPTVALEGASATSATAIEGGFLVTGWATKPPPAAGNLESAAVWRSNTGTTWEAMPLVVDDEDSFHGGYVIGDTLIVSGSTLKDGLGDQLLWVSNDDGLTWGRVAPQPAFSGVNNRIESIIPTADGLLAVGRRWDRVNGHPVPQVWWSIR